jgi:hypothetical protein
VFHGRYVPHHNITVISQLGTHKKSSVVNS